MLTIRPLKNGRFAIYKGRVRYLTPSFSTRAKAQARVDVEHQWRGASFTISNRSVAKEA